MTLRVLGRTSSINVRKVLWTCAELDLTFDHVETDPRLLARNPNALVPVIQDGDFVMWESNAICRYLAGRQPRGTLLPDEPEKRGLVDQWMDWQATELNDAWRYSFLALVRRSPEHTDPVAIQASVAKTSTGRRIRPMEIPEARIAIASLSEDNLLKPVRIPISTAIGIVRISTAGRRAARMSRISEALGDCRTMMSSNSPPPPLVESTTKVRAARAISPGTRTSRKI